MRKKQNHICITRLGQEKYLCREVSQRLASAQCTELAPRVVELSDVSLEELVEYPLFFSAQLLPNALPLSAPSIKTWSTAICELLISNLDETPGPWCLHIFDPATAESGKTYARPKLIYQEVTNLLKQKRRSLLKTLQSTCPPSSSGTTLVQVTTLSPERGFISIARPDEVARCGASLSRHPAGYLAIPDDKLPPSRAFKKLREAIEVFQLSVRRGQTAVDLGASPGGWTYVLAQHGLHITAVDRSPLAPALQRDRRVSFVAGNAFTWHPPRPVDWLVCDVITTPDRTHKLIQEWTLNKLCKHFCVTVKFKGAPDIEELAAIAQFLKAHTTHFDGRQLTHNKNELTLIGTI